MAASENNMQLQDLTLESALAEIGCAVERRNKNTLYAEHCGQPVSMEAWAGGIFGPERVWCRECGAAIVAGSEMDTYRVERSA